MSDIEPNWDGTRLGNIRRELGLHQRELGAAVGIDEPNRQARMSNYECNKVMPNMETFVKMCAATGCTPNQLLGVDEIDYEYV